MKYLALLLALIIQITTCIPCSDTAECNKIVNTENTTTDHTDHAHHEEACSPFCACSCCASIAGFLLFTHPAISFQNKVITPIQYIVGKEQFISHEDQIIWQPPQLV